VTGYNRDIYTYFYSDDFAFVGPDNVQGEDIGNAIWLTQASNGDVFAVHDVEGSDGNGLVSRWRKNGREWQLQEVRLIAVTERQSLYISINYLRTLLVYLIIKIT